MPTTPQSNQNNQPNGTYKVVVALLFIFIGVSILIPPPTAKIGYIGVVVSLIAILVMKMRTKTNK
ncbi:MAG: hypothetical protein HOE53_01825 [Candidatus Magasanikbacteria bacterium]|nr:hypothetical protein [Candidatus Magasanikbacteria bacterium]